MSIKFRCEQCDSKLSIKSSKAGAEIKCPKCRHAQIVPSANGSEQEHATPDEESASGAELQKTRSSARFDFDIKESKSEKENPFSEFAVYDEPELIYSGSGEKRTAANVKVDYDKLAVPRHIVYLQGALLGLASLFFFSLGWWLGSSGSSAGGGKVAQTSCDVSGTIFYESSAGRKIDAGAVVMFLPTDRRPQIRPDASLLFPGNVLTSQNDSVQIIRELGGDVGSVADDGKFELRLENSRTYYMCVLSKNQPKPADKTISKKVRGEISTFFLPVDSLITTQDFQWQTVTIQGKRQNLGDIIF